MSTDNHRNVSEFGSNRSMTGSQQDRNGPVQQNKGLSFVPTSADFRTAMGDPKRGGGVVRMSPSRGAPETLLVGLLAHPRCSRLFNQLLDRAPRVDKKLADRVQLISVGDPRWTELNGGEYVERIGLSAQDLQRDWEEAVTVAGGENPAITRVVHEVAGWLAEGELPLPCLVLQLRQRPADLPEIVHLPAHIEHLDAFATEVLHLLVAQLTSQPLSAGVNYAGSQGPEYSRELLATTASALRKSLQDVVGRGAPTDPSARLSDTKLEILDYLRKQSVSRTREEIATALKRNAVSLGGPLADLKRRGLIQNTARHGYVIRPEGIQALAGQPFRKPRV